MSSDDAVTVVRCSALVHDEESGETKACGQELKSGWRYCAHCGHAISPAQRRASERAMKVSER